MVSERNRATVLYVDNSLEWLNVCKEALEEEGFYVHCATDVANAKRLLVNASIDIIITDLRIESDNDKEDKSGLDLALTYSPSLPVIIFTAHDSIEEEIATFAIERPLPFSVIDIVSKKKTVGALVRAVEGVIARHHRGAQGPLTETLTDVNAASYVTRSAEREILQLLQTMEYVIVIEPWQQGKTSLIDFLARNPPSRQTFFVYVNVIGLERSNESSWYRALCGKIREKLTTEYPEIEWPSGLASGPGFREFISSIGDILLNRDLWLVIALDEIGSIPPVLSKFFELLKELRSSRLGEVRLQRISFILLGSSLPVEVKSSGSTSFNIAYRVRLPDFTPAETTMLMKRLIDSERTAVLLAARVYYWVEGQPYLTRTLCTALRTGSTREDVRIAVEKLRLDDTNHLPPLIRIIEHHLRTSEVLARVVNDERIRFSPDSIKTQRDLELLGLIVADADGFCRIRNRLYKSVIADIIAGRLTEGVVRNEIAKLEIVPEYRVCFWAADPSKGDHLRFGREYDRIQEQIRKAKSARRIILIPRFALKLMQIGETLLEEKPNIIHFSGHGSDSGNLFIEDEVGGVQELDSLFISELIVENAETLECIFLNSCYSSRKAADISKSGKYVIGIEAKINDEDAICFAEAFYQALGNGLEIARAFRYARLHFGRGRIIKKEAPVLFKDGIMQSEEN